MTSSHARTERPAFANLHPVSAMIEHESRARLIAAMTAFHSSWDKASERLTRLTWALLALTVVIALFTIALFFHG
jgi:hypothetical protein